MQSIQALILFVSICVCASTSLYDTGRYISGNFPLYPACNAKYNAPCSIGNTAKIVRTILRDLSVNSISGATFDEIVANVSSGVYDAEDGTGFNPFIVTTDGTCQADSSDSTNKGKHFDEIKSSIVSAVLQPNVFDRIKVAASTGDGWLNYIWSTAGDGVDAKTSQPKNYVGYFRQVAHPSDGKTYVIGCSYVDELMPSDPYCTSGLNDQCSVVNCRSLVGEGLSKLMMAPDVTNLNEVFRQISKESDFKVYKPNGAFTGFYIFMYAYGTDDSGVDTRGINVAHGANAKFVGLNLTEILLFVGNTGVDGEQLHEKFYTAAENGGGWVYYPWANSPTAPATSKIAFIAGIKKLGVKYYIGVGFNHVPAAAAPGPHCTGCSASKSSPCAIKNTFNLISHGQAELLTDVEQHTVFGKLSLEDEFKISGGFYVFMYDYNSTCVVHGANINNVGKTLPGIIQGANLPVDGDQLHEDFKAAANLGGGWVRYKWRNKGEATDYIKVAYLIKVSKYGRFYYAGVGYTNIAAPPTDKCSASYGASCAVDNTLSVIGLAQAEISNSLNPTELSAAFTAITESKPYTFSSDGTFTPTSSYSINDGFQVIVFDKNADVQAYGGHPEFVGLSYDEVVMQQKIDSYTGSQFFSDVKSKADEGSGYAGGEWFEFNYKTSDKYTPEGKVGYTTKAFYTPTIEATGGDFVKETYYLLVVHSERPQPSMCGNCPAHSSCSPPEAGETMGMCKCHPQYKPKFTYTPVDQCPTGLTSDAQVDATMECVASDTVNYQHLGSLRGICLGFVYFIYAIALFFMVWTMIYSKSRVIKCSQPIFLYIIIIGCVCSTSSIFALSTDDNGVAPTVLEDGTLTWPEVDSACQAVPWLYCLGFALSFSTLFAKTWRVTKLFTNKKLMKIKVTIMDTMKWIILVLVFEIVILIIWQIQDPLVWKRYVDKVDGDGNELESHGACISESPWGYIIPLLAFQVLALLYGNVLAYKARTVATEYSESKWIAICMINNLQTLLVGIPILLMVSDQPQTYFIVKFVIIATTDFGILLLIFVPKMFYFYTNPDAAGNGATTNVTSAGSIAPASTAGTTNETSG